jgi:hypothetical protein
MNIGFIYQIYDNTNGNKYYGSTKETLSRRLCKHRGDYKCFLNGDKNKFMTSFKIIENENYAISLVETVEFNDKIELKARERYFIENNECVNKNIPNRTIKEYREANKEKIREYYKQYNGANKDITKQWYEANKEHIKEYYEANKEKIKEKNKEYQQQNKEKIKEKKKQYHQQNKERIKEYQKQYREAKKQLIN